MKLVTSGIRSAAEIPTAFVKPPQSPPTVFRRCTVTAIRAEIRQSYRNLSVLDAFRLLKEFHLTITVDTLDGTRHDCSPIIAPKLGRAARTEARTGLENLEVLGGRPAAHRQYPVVALVDVRNQLIDFK
jgi:hypothetical protein